MKSTGFWRIRVAAGLSAALAAALLIGAAGTPAEAAKRAAAVQRPDRSPVRLLAWAVRPANAPRGSRPDYLIGTAHITLPKGKSVSKEFLRALRGCDRFLVEADLNQVTPEIVAKYILLAEGESLDAMLPEEALAKLEAAARPMGLGREQLNRMEPWYLSMLLTLPSAASPERMLDYVLAQAAKKRKLDVGYLETADDVLAAMDAIDGKEEIAMLIEALDDLEGQRRQARDLEAAYLRSDLPAISKLALQPERARKYPDFFERLLHSRNRKWLPKVESALQNTDAIVAVGLLHLVGKDGLLETLKTRGYKVEAVRL